MNVSYDERFNPITQATGFVIPNRRLEVITQSSGIGFVGQLQFEAFGGRQQVLAEFCRQFLRVLR